MGEGFLGAGMIQITPQMRILLAVQAVDFRKGIDGLAGICRHILGKDPFSGSVFIFRNRRGTAIRALVYDGQGFWLCHKRLSKGTFQWWPDQRGDRVSVLAVHELQLLLWNGNPDQAQVAPAWRKITAGG
jgi:transposase